MAKKEKTTIDKSKKLTETEHKSLSDVIRNHTEVKTSMANLCLEKEVTTRNIEKDFEEKFELLEMKQNAITKKRNSLMDELTEKYGKGVSYNLQNGNITRQENE